MSLIAAAPALPIDEAGKYVVAAYLVFLALVVLYVGIMAARLGRTERELARLNERLAERGAERERNGNDHPRPTEG